MHHRVDHFHTGREAIDQHTASLALQNRKKTACVVEIARIHMDGGGQLTFKAASELLHLIDRTNANDQAERAKYFFAQSMVRQETLASRFKQVWRSLTIR
ncbi:hypothetical protein D9M70_591960 [compost metagenome]